MIPPDVVLSFSYIRGLLSIVRFYWFGSQPGSGVMIRHFQWAELAERLEEQDGNC